MKLLLPALAAASLACTPALARDRFLSDGGGIRTEQVVGTPYGPAVIEVPALGEGRPFLEDGGGIRFAPELPRLPSGAEFRAAPPRSYGSSVSELPDGGYGRRPNRNTSVVIINSGATGEPGIGSGPEKAAPAAPGYGGAKVIRVATARLDRRPFDASGLDIVRLGTAKIIRIAPAAGKPVADEPVDETLELDDGQALAALPAPAPEPVATPAPTSRNGTVTRNETAPVAAPAPTPRPVQPEAAADATAGFEPWTAGWLRDCVSRYPDFDASLGTYTDATGRRRFCTGEP